MTGCRRPSKAGTAPTDMPEGWGRPHDKADAPETTRADAVLAARGLARSRTQAARLIADGLVTLDGAPVVKASAAVREDQELVVAGIDHYVSRAAHKLNAALDAFAVEASGRQALDVGASTGGFT